MGDCGDTVGPDIAHARAYTAEEERDRVVTAAVQEVSSTARRLGYERARSDRLVRALREIKARCGGYSELDKILRSVEADLNDNSALEKVAVLDKSNDIAGGD